MGGGPGEDSHANAVAPVAEAASIPSEPLLIETSSTFRRNQTITDVLLQEGFSSRQVQEFVESTRPVYNLARIRAGGSYWINRTATGQFRDFRYAVDDERYLTVYRNSGKYVPVMKSFAYETVLESVAGTISGSLFAAVTGIGESDQLALDLADIFMWDIDFYTDIQRGDSFRLLVEKRFLEGTFRKYGVIRAAEISVKGKTYTGFRFKDGEAATGYYGPDGTSLRKSFLKSPLKFARISSGFSAGRRHPILKIVRPHLGVDYAAPTGTPVVAVASGRVAAAGYNGGYGKQVHLRHAKGYETMYAHLSRIAVRPGAQVSQGEVIGYVGSTGLATGPHLDFRVIQHGKFVNPQKAVFPPSPPITEASMAAFTELRNELLVQLAGMQSSGERAAK